jgi:hypothetical protein
MREGQEIHHDQDPTTCTTNPEPPRCGAGDSPIVVNFAGHANSVTHHGGDLAINEAAEGMLVMSGVIPVGEGSALTDPAGAEIHAAIAPHGRAKIGEIKAPAGGPTCDCWWVATFLPPSQLQ